VIIIARVGSAGTINLFSGKCWLTDLVFAIQLLENTILNKYLYYYLKFNEENIKKLANRNAAPNINWIKLSNLKISIPSLEKQQEIVNIIENLENQESHYNKYSKILKEELDNIMEIVSNISILSNNNLELDENIINDNESETDLEIEIEDSE
jgi:type I restriction enzyme S subunit